MEDFLDAAKNKLGESVENVAALAAKAGEVGQEALGVLAEAASADVESYGEGMMPPPEPETLAGLLDALVEKDAKVSARDAHKSVTKKDAFKDLSVGKVKKALAAAKKRAKPAEAAPAPEPAAPPAPPAPTPEPPAPPTAPPPSAAAPTATRRSWRRTVRS